MGQHISAACAAHAGLGPATLVLYDGSTLYFETDEGDGFRESGFPRERRLEPQITIGLLTDHGGFPLMVSAFEGNKAETKTMLPVIESFMAAHDLPDVTVVADAGMVSEANEAAGLSFILGARIRYVPYLVAQWRREHPGQEIGDGQVFTQPWPAGPPATSESSGAAARNAPWSPSATPSSSSPGTCCPSLAPTTPTSAPTGTTASPQRRKRHLIAELERISGQKVTLSHAA